MRENRRSVLPALRKLHAGYTVKELKSIVLSMFNIKQEPEEKARDDIPF